MTAPRIYLDSNATTPTCSPARAAALEMMDLHYGNPSSSHAEGLRARQRLERARAAAAQAIGAGAGATVFMSGATEAIHTAVFSALMALRQRREQGQASGELLLVGATEHKAVAQAVAHWNAVLQLGLEVRSLPVDISGQHDLTLLGEWLPRCALLCTMAANNETGVVSDLAAMEALLLENGSSALWLVDCVQALGKLPLALADSRVDYASFSGHKLYAPKGVGLLYVRAGSPFTPLIVGGGQEDGQRSGTENLPGIAAFGAVCEALIGGRCFASAETLYAHRDALVLALRESFPGLVFNAPLQSCLPTTLNFAVPGASSRQLMNLFDAAGIQVSAGSACSAGAATGSHVLDAMGVPHWASSGAIRLSFGPLDTAEFVERACAALRRCGEIWSSHAAAAAEPAGWAPAADTGQVVDAALIDLSWEHLDHFVREHPRAVLVDVREPYESAAAAPLLHQGRPALSAPRSCWPNPQSLPADWLNRPLILVCRSGSRSGELARHLVAQGHTCVRQLSGGLARRP